MSRIAIIGTGIAGMGAAHFLHRHHDLTIFEASDHVGGHANTLDVTEPGAGRLAPIDTGFMVYNEAASPLLSRLFAQLEVPVKKTSLSFSLRDDIGGLEWQNSSLNHLFAQRKNLVNPRFLKLLSAVNRFNKEAASALDDPETSEITLGEYIRVRGYGEDFFKLHLAPMGAALWRTPPEHMLSFPAEKLLRVFRQHGLLGLTARPAWLTVDGGSRQYRDRLIAPFRGLIQLGRPVVRVIRNGPGRGVTVMTGDNATHAFDQVVVATHADQALRILVNPTPDEVRLLSEFKYQATTATLHTDASVLPRVPLARAACNHQLSRDASGRVSPATHYWMNEIQGVSDRENYFVTLNRPESIDDAKVIKRIAYSHPVFSLGTARAQHELPKLNAAARGRTETYFAGAYFGHGFHEDAFASAVQLGELLLARDPWTAEGVSGKNAGPA